MPAAGLASYDNAARTAEYLMYAFLSVFKVNTVVFVLLDDANHFYLDVLDPTASQ